jgi:hypothetical protein
VFDVVIRSSRLRFSREALVPYDDFVTVTGAHCVIPASTPSTHSVGYCQVLGLSLVPKILLFFRRVGKITKSNCKPSPFVCPCAWNNLAPTGRILIKLCV